MADFSAGSYAHLDLQAPEDTAPEAISLLPSPNVGRTSYRNAMVVEVPRKDRGKVTKTIRGSAPTPGGWKRHTTKRQIQVWPKEMLLPAMSHLSFRRLLDPAEPQKIKVRFEVSEVLDPTAPNFRRDLLRCINLLLENVGQADVFPLEVNEAEQLRQAYETIGWEPLPTGGREELTKAVFLKTGKRSPRFQKEVTDRLATIDELKPARRFQGGGHFTTYLAAQFTDELVVLENLRLGAIYVMQANWETLSRMTRSQLLADHAGQFIRIVHQPGWQARLKKLVADARGERDGETLV